METTTNTLTEALAQLINTNLSEYINSIRIFINTTYPLSTDNERRKLILDCLKELNRLLTMSIKGLEEEWKQYL
jgi:hypothetical protein